MENNIPDSVIVDDHEICPGCGQELPLFILANSMGRFCNSTCYWDYMFRVYGEQIEWEEQIGECPYE